ncbi:MAG: KpsF/GutQ family sugar-phosphate isomerase [Gemmatimonadetes bacterium]|nr:KpsF/GutQ family sugar-phosphate isomerase [Gemmatimonadota bacterium]
MEATGGGLLPRPGRNVNSEGARVLDSVGTATAAAAVAVSDGELVGRARRVLRAEAEALLALEQRIGEAFLRAVRLIGEAPGRVIVSGVGKSGVVGRKIAATLTSTGTPAIFLHPVEGLHGDLGIVGPGDVALLISKSGESDELSGLVQYLSRLGVAIVVLCGRPDSALARAATVVLDCSVAEEACPFDLAPTTSTTAAMAMGDALAVALLLRKGFTRDDFARLHPGGALGRKLTLRVSDVMLREDYPFLPPDGSMRRCVVLLAEKRGTVPIVDGDQRVVGVVTAGDLTRLMERQEKFLDIPVSQVMNRNPKITGPDVLGAAAVYQMEKFGIMAMPVVDGEQRLLGIVHLHDLLRAGAV